MVYTVDTGASVSLLSSKLFTEIPVSDRPALSTIVPIIHNADGKPIPCRGSGVFRMMLGPLYLEKNLIVADITDDVLLGADVLLGDESGRADLLFSKNIIILRDVEIPIETEGYPKRVRRVRLADNYIIPAMTEVIADVLVDREEVEEETNFIIEPVDTFTERYSLIMAPSLVDISRKVTQPVRIMNPFPTSMSLSQDCVIGTAAPVEAVEVLDNQEDEDEVANTASIRQLKLDHCNEGIKPLCSDPKTGDRMEVPKHMETLFQNTSKTLSPEQSQTLAEFFYNNEDVFSKHDLDLGLTHLTEHAIDTGDAPPIKSAPRRVPLSYINEADAAVQKFFDQGTARDSTSPWSSPLVFVRKKNGQVRPCVDYRRLNNITRKDAFPLPRAQDCFDTVAGATLFSSMDITSAYNQIPIRKEDIPKTAFVTKYGLFEFTTMPFGLCNAPATFQRVMELALAGLQWKICLVYLDDVLIFSKTFEEHIKRLSDVLDRIRMARLKLKPAKCHFLQTEVTYLGHILSAEGVRPNKENVDRILAWKNPTNVKEVRSFLGMANYYRRFIHGFSYYAHPLVNLTRTGVRFKWTDACTDGFNHIKFMLMSPAIMAHPRHIGQYILDTDASDVNIGAVLSQIQDKEEKVIAFGSKSLSKAEKNYCVTDRELLAIRYFLEYYRCYLLGRQFLVRTDHQALKWLLNMKDPKNRVARWIEVMSEFNFIVQHRAGVKHGNADAMSRCPNPWDCHCKNVEVLKCGPCRKCHRKTEMMDGSFPEVLNGCEASASDDAEQPAEGVGLNQDGTTDDVAAGTTCRMGQMKQSWTAVEFFMVTVVNIGFLMFGWTYGPLQMMNFVLQGVAWMMVAAPWVMISRLYPLLYRCLWRPVTFLHLHLCELFHLADSDEQVASQELRNKHLECTSNDGRTRPKERAVHVNLGRGSSDQVRVSKSDLRSAWPLKTSFKDVVRLQLADPYIGPIYKWFQAGKRPRGPEVSASSAATRHYWLCWDSLVMKDGVLHRWFHHNSGSSYLQVLIPTSLKEEILYQMHDNILSGHLGNKKTRDRLLQRFYWFGARNDVNHYVQMCDVCTSIKGRSNRPPRAPLGQMPTGAPLDRLSTDIMGPLPTSNRGNKYVLVVTDHFTRWVEIFAVPDQTAVTCAEIILNDVIARFGCPHDMHSDQGRNYISQIFVDLCRMLEIRKTRSSPYNPRCNGQAERFNRTLIKMIKAYMKGQEKDWDRHLGCLAGAYRASVHESTRFTPNFLMLGREVRLPAQILYSSCTNDEFVSYSHYVKELKSRMEAAHEIARKHLGTAAKRQKEAYDAKSVLYSYQAGDLAWYASKSTELHIAPKLRKSYTGPVVIIKKFNDLNYMIQVDAKKAKKVVNHDKLLPYKGKLRPRWITTTLKNL